MIQHIDGYSVAATQVIRDLAEAYGTSDIVEIIRTASANFRGPTMTEEMERMHVAACIADDPEVPYCMLVEWSDLHREERAASG